MVRAHFEMMNFVHGLFSYPTAPSLQTTSCYEFNRMRTARFCYELRRIHRVKNNRNLNAFLSTYVNSVRQARSTRTCEVSVTCKKSCSNMKLSKWTQFPALVTGLSRYYVNKNWKKYFLIHLIFINMHRVLTLSS